MLTSRLRLRRLRPSDLDPIAVMAADPEQMRFYPHPKSRDEVVQWLRWNFALYEEHGFGTWCVESLPDEAFAGYCGLRPLELEAGPEIELNWHVKKTHWNRGVATEAAAAAKRLAFGRFGLARVVAIVNPQNLASRRVAQKLGMAEERTLVHDGQQMVLYAAAP